MKSIVMVCGGIQQRPAVNLLKNAGYSVIITDRNPNAPTFADADLSVNIDAHDVQSLIAWILLHKNKFNITGIFTLTNQAPSVAMVASATGLPTLPVHIVMQCDNKLLMKRKFKENYLPTANFFEVSSAEEVKEAYNSSDNREMYLKAADSFGGKGIQKITEAGQIDSAYNSIKEITTFPIIILEESLNGSFIDAQGIFFEGKFHRAGIADSFFSNTIEEFKDYNPVEIFNVSPTQHKDAVVNDVYQLLEKAAIKLGLNWGPVGGDFILCDSGLKIIEIAPRLHGPNGSLQIFPASTGIKPLEFMVQCIAGENPNPEYLEPKFNKVALCKVFISNQQIIREINFKTDPHKLDGLFSWFVYLNGDESIIQSKTNLSGLASFFVSDDTYEKALLNMKKVENALLIR